MSTRQQRAAIRRKAERSANPCVPQAKPASGGNAPKHGIVANRQIMFDENEESLAQLDDEIRGQYSPANPTERFLVDTLVHKEWRLRRMRGVEAALWQRAGETYLAAHPEIKTFNSAHAFGSGSTAFERLQRLVNSCERNYHRALSNAFKRSGRLPQPPRNPNNPNPLLRIWLRSGKTRKRRRSSRSQIILRARPLRLPRPRFESPSPAPPFTL